MHAVAWRILRSASKSRCPARVISGRRYPHAPRTRPFHSTRKYSQTSTPPTDPQNPTIEQNGRTDHDRDNPAAAEASGDAAKPEEPEVIAKKLQRSKEMVRHYGSALKRSQRNNRSQDLPPIYIPNWFLRRNVVLDKGYQRMQGNWLICRECALTVKDKESGETYAAFPFPAPLPHIMRILEDLSSTIGEVAWVQEQKRRLWPPDGDPKTYTEALSQRLEKKDMMPKGIMRLAQEPLPPGKQIHENGLDASTNILRDPVSSHLHFWILAEITATIAACLSVVRPELGVSFPAAKTNITLHCPAEGNSGFLPELVHSIAGEIGVDVVQLDAQDFAEIAGDYLGEGLEPSSDSIRSLGYETYRFKSELQEDIEEIEENEEGLDEEDTPENSPPSFGFPGPKPFPRSAKPPNLMAGAVHVFNLENLAKSPILKALSMQSGGRDRGTMISSSNPFYGRLQSQNEVQLEDMKLTALLEALIDSDELKRSIIAAESGVNEQGTSEAKPVATDAPKFFDFSLNATPPVDVDLSPMLSKNAQSKISLTLQIQPSQQSYLKHSRPQNKKIILIRDIKELGATRRGSQILQKLQDIIRKRRAEGEQIMVVGTTSSPDLVPEVSKSGIKSLQSEGNDSYSRTIVVPPLNAKNANSWYSFLPKRSDGADLRMGTEMQRNADINFRHIQDMLRRLDPAVTADLIDPECALHLPFPPTNQEVFMDRVLSFDEVHRIALAAIGIHLSRPKPSLLSNAHLSLAMSLLDLSDEVKFNWATQETLERTRESKTASSVIKSTHEVRRDRISKANKHEKRLLGGVINPEKINTTFSDVHAPKETIEALRTLTSLSLLRPEAFQYGVLATDKIPGLLLYGPPGTGKTLLAKAVAKESGATVLEVSGSEVYDMYVGEGEKNVRAIFSLARKLSPCVVFIDEADAIFGSRDGGRQRTSHREIINQFLKEWDGMNDLSVFIMVATNRPFDLDDAVLRRLPRRLLVDLPTQADRQKILAIHLKDELLDKKVNLEELARRTPLYSGSDLKNMAVAAALACVREENENAAIAAAKALSTADTSKPEDGEQANQAEQDAPKLVPGQKYEFPEKRTLHTRHFDKAMQEISASISEDMSSLSAIKKFDEQFGDRKGRRKKSAYGFGMQPEKDEAAARVRA